MNVIIPYMIFHDWLLSLSIVFNIHPYPYVYIHIYQYFVPFYGQIIFHCVDGPHLFSHSPVDGHLGNSLSLLNSLASLILDFFTSMCNLYHVQAYFLFSFFWPPWAACGIWVPWPGMSPMPPAMEAWSPNHWTARGFPRITFLNNSDHSTLY